MRNLLIALLGGIVAGEIFTIYKLKPSAEKKSKKLEKKIDDTLAESFPASDAPNWTLGLTN